MGYYSGKLGYEAYGDSTDWKNFQNNPMPQWDELPENIRQAWCAASNVIQNDYAQNKLGEVEEFLTSMNDDDDQFVSDFIESQKAIILSLQARLRINADRMSPEHIGTLAKAIGDCVIAANNIHGV